MRNLENLTEIPDMSNQNPEALQDYFDNDKYLASHKANRDLCGEYADFCKMCDKSAEYPCAKAYLRLRSTENEIENNSEELANIVLPQEMPQDTEQVKKRVRIAVAKRKKN